MPQEFLSMTVQSFWNGEPRAAATAEKVMETDGMTAKQVYDGMKEQTIEEWKAIYTQTSFGRAVVLHYSRELNDPQPTTDIAIV